MYRLFLLLVSVAGSGVERLPRPQRIVNGVDCNSEEFPYVVSIRVGRPPVHLCGGSLVDGRHVLTAAHCYLKGWRYVVVAGQTHLQDFTEQVQVQRVQHVYLHPRFHKNKTVGDVAVFRLGGEIRETLNTRYVRLPARGVRMSCGRVRTAGWGRLVDDDVSKLVPLNLRCVRLAVLEASLCRQYFPGLEADLEPSFCTLEPLSNRGVCYGDSGGPIMCGGVQYGIVSWGFRCFGQLPQVHTNVSVYAAFIGRALASSSAALAAPSTLPTLAVAPALYAILSLCLLVVT